MGFMSINTQLQAGEELIFGKWGTDKQCARELITAKGTKRAAPFEISTDWLGHGDVWCRLKWGTPTTTSDSLFTHAHALCGEDAVRAYLLKFYLTKSELTFTWNDSYKTGPIMRCDF